MRVFPSLCRRALSLPRERRRGTERGGRRRRAGTLAGRRAGRIGFGPDGSRRVHADAKRGRSSSFSVTSPVVYARCRDDGRALGPRGVREARRARGGDAGERRGGSRRDAICGHRLVRERRPSFARAGTGLAPRGFANATATAVDAVAAARAARRYRLRRPSRERRARRLGDGRRGWSPRPPHRSRRSRNAPSPRAAAPLRANAAAAAAAAAPPPPLVAGGAFAERVVGAWLVGGCAWVFSMVVLGGVTRLTRSGLSMTDWKFQWESPPFVRGGRGRASSPSTRASAREFRLSNASMTVDEYKFIFWMEYGHRMWGRGLGAFFALPLCAFLAKGWITKRLGARLVSFFGSAPRRARLAGGWSRAA